MKIDFMCFGITKDLLGGRTVQAEVPHHCTVHDFIEILHGMNPKLKDLTSLKVAIDGEYAEPEMVIDGRQEIVLIPPVSGG